MRITRSLLFFAGVATIASVAPSSVAQTFPATNTWTAMQRTVSGTTSNVTDAPGSGTASDIVGTASDPAAYVYSDNDFLYFRIRVSADPSGSGEIGDGTWGCVIDTDGNLTRYEFLAVYDGKLPTPAAVLRQNSGPSADSTTDNAETTLKSNAIGGTYPGGTYGRVSSAGTNLGGATPDYFVDLAVERSFITAAGFPLTRSLRFICGTGTVSGQINTDVFSDGTTTLSTNWSDGYVCGNAGCQLDQDQDGVPDAVETALLTDKTKKDSDGDGINDNVELTAIGAPAGTYTAVDTDGDGTIDANDLDSDNDCRSDQVETAFNYRTKDANPSSVCTDPAKPACSSATGTCTACDGPNSGTTPAKCPSAAAPACNANGTCSQCKQGQTDLCAGTTPACGPSLTCVACNGDNGDTAATARCPSASAPACQKSGANIGQCKACSATNTSLCTSAAAPACDTATGACAACNGDFDGGTTKGCPSAANPVCALTGANAGTCGKCTSNADCGTGHTGPTCNMTTGACFDTDSDGDGLFDSVEINLGTDPSKADTDGDGINDNVEVTPTSGGPKAKVDSDGDGTIDALDTDSDKDGVPDAQEGSIDTDGDGAADFRDPDDDGDQIPTTFEIADAVAGKVSDDVDGDGKKNWLDTDSDGNGIDDGTEGRGDEDSDGILDYLDAVKDAVKFDAGSSSGDASTSSSGGQSTSSSGGFTVNPDDAGRPDTGPPPFPEEGVVEGTGLLCTARRAAGGGNGELGLAFVGALVTIAAARRRRR